TLGVGSTMVYLGRFLGRSYESPSVCTEYIANQRSRCSAGVPNPDWTTRSTPLRGSSCRGSPGQRVQLIARPLRNRVENGMDVCVHPEPVVGVARASRQHRSDVTKPAQHHDGLGANRGADVSNVGGGND